jgi:hypothetical protein
MLFSSCRYAEHFNFCACSKNVKRVLYSFQYACMHSEGSVTGKNLTDITGCREGTAPYGRGRLRYTREAAWERVLNEPLKTSF